MFDVTALGELIMDFTPAGISEFGSPLFEQNPGGAPANVAACVTRLGGSAAYIGKVGQDAFGRALKANLSSRGVDVSGVKDTRFYPTALAFALPDPTGGTVQTFYHSSTADVRLTEGEVELSLIDNARAFCFGSVSMTDEPACTATMTAAGHAKQLGRLVCYDPNLRIPLWENERVARDCILRGMQYAQLLKLSRAEFEFVTGGLRLEHGCRSLLKEFNLTAVVVTLGEQGAYCATLSHEVHVPAYNIPVLDTTGAGDAFVGGLLYRILRFDKPLDRLTLAELMVCLDFATAVGSMTTTMRGAMNALPTIEQVYECMRNTPKLV